MLSLNETIYYLMRPDEALNIWYRHKKLRDQESYAEHYEKISFGMLMAYFFIGIIGLALIIIGIVYCMNAWSHGLISNRIFAFCMFCFLLGGIGGVISVTIVFIVKRKPENIEIAKKYQDEPLF